MWGTLDFLIALPEGVLLRSANGGGTYRLTVRRVSSTTSHRSSVALHNMSNGPWRVTVPLNGRSNSSVRGLIAQASSWCGLPLGVLHESLLYSGLLYELPAGSHTQTRLGGFRIG